MHGFFYVAAGLMLAGAAGLLFARGPVARGIAGVAVAAGIGVLAAGADSWAILAGSILLISALPLPVLRKRASLPDAQSSRVHRTATTVDSGGRGSSLRRLSAALLSAAFGGVLLSVVWSNPLWKVKLPADREWTPPGSGLVLVLAILVVILILSPNVARIRRAEEDIAE